MMKVKKVIITIIFSASLILVTYFASRQYADFQEKGRQKLIYEARKSAWGGLERQLRLEISQFKGQAAVVIKDLRDNREITYNKEVLFPSASLTKIPIMATCYFSVQVGKLKLERDIVSKTSDKFTGSGILKNVTAGTTFSVEELIGLMIYDSDNMAINILTNLLGVEYINQSFKVFGLKNTSLSRKAADFSSRDKGIENYTTAEDIALILEKIYRKRLVSKVVSEKCLQLLKLQRVNDRIPKYLPVNILVAHKTGLENGVCHDAGIVFTRNGDFIVVVLTKHANSNSNLSKEFIAKVSLYAYKYFEQLQ